MARVSASVVDDYIAAWRRARLSCDQGKLYYPAINVLHAAWFIAGESDHEPQDDPAADTVQRIVEQMPGEIRTVFEAYHLGIIRGEWCRDRPHKWRRLVLGIMSKDVYEIRERAGWAFVRDGLEQRLEVA